MQRGAPEAITMSWSCSCRVEMEMEMDLKMESAMGQSRRFTSDERLLFAEPSAGNDCVIEKDL